MKDDKDYTPFLLRLHKEPPKNSKVVRSNKKLSDKEKEEHAERLRRIRERMTF